MPQLQVKQLLHQKILLIGDTQTGKSTFANLITRMGYTKFLNKGNVTEMDNCGKVNKVGKTIGCDVFVGVRNLEKKYQIQQPSGSYLRQDND